MRRETWCLSDMGKYRGTSNSHDPTPLRRCIPWNNAPPAGSGLWANIITRLHFDAVIENCIQRLTYIEGGHGVTLSTLGTGYTGNYQDIVTAAVKLRLASIAMALAEEALL